MFTLIASLLGLAIVPSGTLVWANGGLVMAVTLAVALLVCGAGIVAMRERSKPVRRLSVAPPTRKHKHDSRLSSAA